MNLIIFLSFVGLGICVYSLYIEYNMQKNTEYKPLCDLSDFISCSKPIASPYSRVFGVSNSIIGAAFYAGIITLMWLGMHHVVFYVTLAGALSSIYFACLLFIKVKALCILCISVYAINICLLWASL